MTAEFLRVKDLAKTYTVGKPLWRRLLGEDADAVHAVDGVDFEVADGETLGLVGESGCGKSTLARCLVRLEQPDRGQIWFEGQDLMNLSPAELTALRRRIQMVFQDPYSSLNPRMSIQGALSEAMVVHDICSPREAGERVAQLLDRVGIPVSAAQRRPAAFSGGQRQRIGIARALALEPDLLVADEPVSALDVSIQAQIINLIMELQESMGLSMVFIAHDLRVVQHVSHRVAVMYLGRIVEIADTTDLFSEPAHPYTQALMKAAPVIDPGNKRRKVAVSGEPPSPMNIPSGCRFRTRCPLAMEKCKEIDPPMRKIGDGHFTACHLYEDGMETGSGGQSNNLQSGGSASH